MLKDENFAKVVRNSNGRFVSRQVVGKKPVTIVFYGEGADKTAAIQAEKAKGLKVVDNGTYVELYK